MLERPVAKPNIAYDFGVSLPDKTRFPFPEWQKISGICLRHLATEPVRYDSPQGRLELRQALMVAKQLSDKHTSSFSQARLAKFIQDGYLAKHIRKMHKIYALRRKCLRQKLSTHLSEWIEPIPSVAGLHLTALATSGLSVNDLLAQKTQVGVTISSLTPFYASSVAKPGLIFAYGLIEVDQIGAGLLRLRDLAIANFNQDSD